jgi:mono/diheme cytochrome c family protein
VYLHNFSSYRLRNLLVISPAIFLGFAVLAGPLKIVAQNQPPAPETAPASPSQPKSEVELPEGDGKAIATEYCQDCHKLTNVAKARKAPDDWHDTVQTMMDRGARLPQDKFEILVRYLAKNFGPQTPAPVARTTPSATPSPDSAAATTPQAPKTMELPEGDGRAIATEYCQDCHKLTNLTKARKAPDDWHDTVQTMMDRGARLPQDKVDVLVAYLAKNFGPIADAPSGNGSPNASPAPASPSNH